MQEQKLRDLLAYLNLHSPFYRELFARHTIDIGSVRTVQDLKSIPPTTKEDMQQRGADFLCVTRGRIIEYTSTSGTLGSPVTIPLTEMTCSAWLRTNTPPLSVRMARRKTCTN